MKKTFPRGRILPFLFVLGVSASAIPAGDGSKPPREEYEYPVPIRKPVVRIGIATEGRGARIRSAGGMEILDPSRREKVWKEVHRGELMVVAEPPEGGDFPDSRFAVQVASFSDEENAEKFAKELQVASEGKTMVKYHAPSEVYRVRVGTFKTAEEAFQLTESLREDGFEELWVVEEPVELRGAARMRLVDGWYRGHLVEAERLYILPHEKTAPLSVNGTAYRGILEVRIDPYAQLQIINILHIEEYLRGVVPAEMGPSVYPALEALKAQAIAARTYIVRNLGQFQDRGYDICDTPHCQVYRGIDGEHPLTDRAIKETRGLVLENEGEPINALYTSTCGGHTEDVEAVFLLQKAPYLRGVPCYPERLEVVRLRTARRQPVILLEDGALGNVEMARMKVLGVLSESGLDPEYLSATALGGETRGWIDRTLDIIGKGATSPGRNHPTTTLRELSAALVQELGWEERLRLTFSRQDLPHLLAYQDGPTLDPEEKRRFGYFLHLGILRPFSDGTLRPDHHPSRGMVLKILHQVVRSYDALSAQEGQFLGLQSDRYRIGSPLKERSYLLSPDVYLFRRMDGRSLPTEELVLYPGDSLRFHATGEVVPFLELLSTGRGLSDDRSSPLSRWEVRYTREELEKLLQKRFSLGRLRDLEVIQRGVSGRVSELLVKGTRGEFRIRGFRIRTALGLRETLFVVDRQFGPDGNVETFVFSGRGWGHGVGLCQVGAYGMALRGEGYLRILRHYYTGVNIRKGYSFPLSGS